MHKFTRIRYQDLNSRQKETFNFQKVSGLLAEFGFATLPLTDDWNGADFLAVHINGEDMLRVQLKGRMTFRKSYIDRNLWICFRFNGEVFMYPHDEFLKKALKVTNIENTKLWAGADGGYSFPTPPRSLSRMLEAHCLGRESTPAED